MRYGGFWPLMAGMGYGNAPAAGGRSLPTTNPPAPGGVRPHGHARQMTVIVARLLCMQIGVLPMRRVARGAGAVEGCDAQLRLCPPACLPAPAATGPLALVTGPLCA